MHIFMDGPFPYFFNSFIYPWANIKWSLLESDKARNQLYFYFSSFSFLNVSKKKMCSRKEEDGKKYFVTILSFCSPNFIQITGPKSQSGPSWKTTFKDLSANNWNRSTVKGPDSAWTTGGFMPSDQWWEASLSPHQHQHPNGPPYTWRFCHPESR